MTGKSSTKFAIYHAENMSYCHAAPFRPSPQVYPECPFAATTGRTSWTATGDSNAIYDGIRELFRIAGLDAGRFGAAEWNPLGAYIRPGDRVLVKPNLVMDVNPTGLGSDCLYTHPSVIAAVTDYIILALEGHGKVVIADAPVQGCNFENLVERSGLRSLVEFYRMEGLDVELKDLRGIRTQVSHHVIRQELVKGVAGIVIDLGDRSSFEELSSERMDSLRITDYDPIELSSHHRPGKHEYYVSDEILSADVVVNLPKVKTHCKAGITGALKNMVGVNVRKEYLPHHSMGCAQDGFDEYKTRSFLRRASSAFTEARNRHLESGSLAQLFLLAPAKFFEKLAMSVHHDPSREGSWWGNDTIWRMVLDLNKIAFHADREGALCDEACRKMLCVGDMVVFGQGDGPIRAEPGYAGILTFCDSPVVHDVGQARLLGTSPDFIPCVAKAVGYEGPLGFPSFDLRCICQSNDVRFDGIPVCALNEDLDISAKPAPAWRGHFLRSDA